MERLMLRDDATFMADRESSSEMIVTMMGKEDETQMI